MNRQNKRSIRPMVCLILLLCFHLFGNLIWIKLNQAYPPWDQAYHTLRSFYFLDWFKNLFKGQFNLYPFIDSYGPLVRFTTGFIMFITVPSIKLAQFVNTIFFLLTIVMIFVISRYLFKDDWSALIASFIFSFFLAVYDYSRWLLLDIPLLFFLLVSYFFLLKSQFFSNFKNTFWFFIFTSAVALIKIQGLVYLIIPLIIVLFQAFKEKNHKWLLNLFLGGFIFTCLLSWWLIPNLMNLNNYLQFGIKAEPISDPTNLWQLNTWFHYLKLIIDYLVTPFVFIFFCLFLFYFLKDRKQHGIKLLIIINLAFYYLLLSGVPNKDMRYIFPILPWLAIIFGEGFIIFKRTYKIIALVIIFLMVAYNTYFYINLSYGIPFKKGRVKQFNTPILGEVVYYNLSDYPVRQFDPNHWPLLEIITDISNLDNRREKKVLLAVDYEKINNSNLVLLQRMSNIKNIIFDSPPTRGELDKFGGLKSYVIAYDYLVISSADVNPFYLFNKKTLSNLTFYIKQEGLSLVRQYDLPDKTSLLVYLIKK